jgi:hypothetical protein
VWICVSSTDTRQIGMLQGLTKPVPMRYKRHDCSHSVLFRLRGSSLHILRRSQADTIVGFTRPRNANSTLLRDQSEEPLVPTYDRDWDLVRVILDICWNNASHPFNLSSRCCWGVKHPSTTTFNPFSSRVIKLNNKFANGYRRTRRLIPMESSIVSLLAFCPVIGPRTSNCLILYNRRPRLGAFLLRVLMPAIIENCG